MRVRHHKDVQFIRGCPLRFVVVNVEALLPNATVRIIEGKSVVQFTDLKDDRDRSFHASEAAYLECTVHRGGRTPVALTIGFER